MALKTKLNPMGAFGVKYYTLTVITSPANATCVLTVNGVQYTTKSLRVKAGTVVSYSVSYTDTTTKTGSITMDSDKTLTFNRTYSTSTIYQPWTQPTATSSDRYSTTSNTNYNGVFGAVGGSIFAVESSPAIQNGDANALWKAFQSTNTAGYFSTYVATANGYPYITFYNPTALKVEKFTISNAGSTGSTDANGYTPSTGDILASDNGSSWTTIKNFTNPDANCNKGVVWDLDVPSSASAYKYWKIVAKTSKYLKTTAMNGRWQTTHIEVHATIPQIQYTYYFDLTIT